MKLGSSFYLFMFILLAITALLPGTASADCNCGLPYYATYYCYSLFCNGRVTVIYCSTQQPHNSCIRCTDGAVEVPCCPDSPAYSAYVGGDCNIHGASRVKPADLYVRGFAQGCDGRLVPVVRGFYNFHADGRTSQ